MFSSFWSSGHTRADVAATVRSSCVGQAANCNSWAGISTQLSQRSSGAGTSDEFKSAKHQAVTEEYHVIARLSVR